MGDTVKLSELLAHWQAFSLLQQRAFAYLAAEAVFAGNEFENSTDGAALLLTRIGEMDQALARDETNNIVQKLQSADRSRQGLEQVASVLNTLKAQHAQLVTDTQNLADLPTVEIQTQQWIDALAEKITLADWRNRLLDALNGREINYDVADYDDTELF